MRNLLHTCVLTGLVALPVAAQAPRFIKMDIVSKTAAKHAKKACGGPTEVHMRFPVALAKSVLETAADQEIKVDGKTTKLKMDQLLKLLETSKSGDILFELTTSEGDNIRCVLE